MPTTTTALLAAGLIASFGLVAIAQARPTVATREAAPRLRAETTRDESTLAAEACPDTAKTIAARVGARVKVLEAARLRNLLGHDSIHDSKIARSTLVTVQAMDPGRRWLLVSDSSRHVGWVKPCEIARSARHIDDRVVVTREGTLASRPRDGHTVMNLEKGTALTVVDWRDDSVLVLAADGMRGWYPASQLITTGDNDAEGVWQPGMAVDWPCTGSQHERADAIRCGEGGLRILAITAKKRAPALLLGTDDGRWGWVTDRVTAASTVEPTDEEEVAKVAHVPVTAKPARPRIALDAPPDSSETAPNTFSMAGMMMPAMNSATSAAHVITAPGEPAHEIVMDGMGDMSSPSEGASLSVAFLTTMPFGDAMAGMDGAPMRSPYYQATVAASGGGHLGGDYEYGIAASFSAAGSLTTEGQTRGEDAQGGQGSVSICRRFGPHTKVALGGGYALAFVSPGATASSDWDFLATHQGPYAKLVVSGEPSSRWSYSLLGTAQLTSDADGMPASILVADVMAMASLNSWASLRTDAMVMKMAMGDAMWSASPGFSFALVKHLSASLSATGMAMGGMTMWTTTAGIGAHF